MGKNLPLIIALAGGALVFLLWQQRRRQAGVVAPAPTLPAPAPSAWDVPLVGTYEAGWT